MLDSKKVATASTIAILFVVLSQPTAFSLSDQLLKQTRIRTTFDNCPGLPTIWGHIIHGLVFAIVVYVLLGTQREKPKIKIENTQELFKGINIHNDNE